MLHLAYAAFSLCCIQPMLHFAYSAGDHMGGGSFHKSHTGRSPGNKELDVYGVLKLGTKDTKGCT